MRKCQFLFIRCMRFKSTLSLSWILSLLIKRKGYNNTARIMSVPNIIKETARNLRKNQTKAEELLWSGLRGRVWELKVYRQKPLLVMKENNGFERYVIADFYFPHKKLIVEIDGSIHYKEDVYLLDREKEILLQSLWYTILRFTNEEIFTSRDAVIEKITSSSGYNIS